MNSLPVIMERIRQFADNPAIFWQGEEYNYNDFRGMIQGWESDFHEIGVKNGTVCAYMGDYSPKICALTFALMQRGAILVPFTPAVKEGELNELMELAGVEVLIRFSVDDTWSSERYNFTSNPLIASFSTKERAGLVVFTSGSTGKPKGILHDCDRVLHKFIEMRSGRRTLLFLMLDHFGGFNTLISTFAYGGTAVCLPDRNPESVCRIIKQSRATLLPATPTFINLLIASRCYTQYDLSSIELISYGTEVMPETTLKLVREIFPNAQIKQTYGLSELGVLRSKSEGDDSVWVQIGGAGFETRIVDNILWVRSEANMVGYLNAPSPFDSEGWMCTGDRVEVCGEYMRILGRVSDMINVGGQKVFPSEVESILLKADNVRAVTVFGDKHPIMGQVVKARVSLHEEEDPLRLSERLRTFCMERMAKYKVPIRFMIVNESDQYNARYKKIRKFSGDEK